MSPNIPGLSGYNQPNVFSRVRSIRRSISIPGGLRILAIIGLGQSEETIILSAQGEGLDGVNPDYSGSDAPDGRHFTISKQNLVPRRTDVLLDGIPLTGVEETITASAFNSKYDYRLEPATGRIELQRAHLVDQGGMYAPPGGGNIGSGSISTLELIDANAPTETWTIKATSVVRDAYGDPVSGVTVFSAIGSVSGQPLDAYGAPVVFISDGVIRDNGIIRVALTEGGTPFDRGDRFSVKVESGVLSKGQVLEARYIAEENLNDPEFFVDPNALFAKHGFASEVNTLSLGASMAFENGASGILALQAKPPIPRRTSEVVLDRNNALTAGVEGFPAILNSSADLDAFMYPVSGTPDFDSKVNILVVDKTTGAETQLPLTKVDFYDATITADPYNNFVVDGGTNYSYTVIQDGQVEDAGVDGVIVLGQSTFTASSAAFAAYNLDLGEVDTSKQIRILSTDVDGEQVGTDAGLYTITSVGDGLGNDNVVTVTRGGFTGFTSSKTGLRWELVDDADLSSYVLFTKDVYTSGAIKRGDGLRITYIDTDDATFFDANWAAAFESMEAVDCQMIVPLPNAAYSSIQQAVISHCALMSNTANQKERVALIGSQMGVTSEALIGRELVAVEDVGTIEGIQGDDAEEVLAGNIEDLQNFDVRENFGTTFRAIYFWPDEIVRSINGSNTTIHGFYVAAAAGGLLAATANVAIPLTRKVLTGFTVPRSKIRRPIILNALGDRGVSVVQPVVGGGQILHCKTTTSSGDPLEEEPSVVFIRDRVAQVLRDAARAFIGQPADPTLAASITSSIVKALQALASQGLITTYQNLNVSRDSVEARQWNVSVEVLPTLPINWIFIDVSVSA